MLSPAEARRLFEAIGTTTLAGRRDRALVSVMLYSFARAARARSTASRITQADLVHRKGVATYLAFAGSRIASEQE